MPDCVAVRFGKNFYKRMQNKANLVSFMNNGNIAKISGGANRHKIFYRIISPENLFLAWNEFKKGKENKLDVQKFFLNAEDNIFALHYRLKNNAYFHSHYTAFYVRDPKLRHIHKAKVADRVLHHAVMRIIEPIFEKTFIFDSYSSRKNKGTHMAVKRLRHFAWKLSKNSTETVWFLKADIRKFFDSIDHDILLDLVKNRIKDEKAIALIEKIIRSFAFEKDRGIPLGNLTSQLFSNVYLNELDQFVKRKLKARYYIRYADDFVVIGKDAAYLKSISVLIERFLREKLSLQMHPQKIIIKKWSHGVDFLGYVSFPHYAILRAKTKRRMLRKIHDRYDKLRNGIIIQEFFGRTVNSYLGILKHCRGYGNEKKIKEILNPARK